MQGLNESLQITHGCPAYILSNKFLVYKVSSLKFVSVLGVRSQCHGRSLVDIISFNPAWNPFNDLKSLPGISLPYINSLVLSCNI